MKSTKTVQIICMAALLAVAGMLSAAAGPAANSTLTVYRCEDAKGKVSLQDSPCAKSSKQEAREMLRPKDAPAKPNVPIKPSAVIDPQPAQPVAASPWLPPPELYECTTFDGKSRDSETYDTNRRCVPLEQLNFHYDKLPLDSGTFVACRWVEDSCVKYEENVLCNRWQARLKQAQSDVRYAFSDTSAFRKSELARIKQIVQRSCR